MTISSSLNASVAGLNANATRLATISDNIANSGTYGYKRADTDFESMVISQSSNSGTYSAGGVRANNTRLIEERGAIVSTANSMDIALSGRGMLPVIQETKIGSSTGNDALLMTRTGSFKTDINRMLKTETGLVLMGWPADSDGTIPTMARDSIESLEPVVINANQTAADPTSRINLGINLPATETEYGSSGAARPATIEYFGNLGTSEKLNVKFYPHVASAATDPGTNNWTMVLTDDASGGKVVGVYDLTFSPTSGTGGTLQNVTPAASLDFDGDGTDDITVDLDGDGADDAYAADAAWAYDDVNGSIGLSLANGLTEVDLFIGKYDSNTGLTQFSDDFTQTNITKDGSPVGNLTGVEIDSGGFIRATYDTGFTRVIYQIPLVDVPNYNGLTALNNQCFAVSPESGSFYLWDAGDGPTGDVVGYAREGSTTDVAQELTNLIQTQRAYSSNAKIITTVDEMLQETTNMKR